MTPKKDEKPEVKQEPPKDIAELLGCIQRKLKAPKSQYNKHGGFHYRKCEDILEGLKPLLPAGAYVTVQDSIQQVGDRFYIEATASIHYKGQTVSNKAYARETLEQKGMQAAQLTGSTSSYARKYALNGLFLIDDTEDADAKDKDKPNEKEAFVVNKVDRAEQESMYDQCLEKLNGATDLAELQAAWKPYANSVKNLDEDLATDLIRRKDNLKTQFSNGQGAH